MHLLSSDLHVKSIESRRPTSLLTTFRAWPRSPILSHTQSSLCGFLCQTRALITDVQLRREPGAEAHHTALSLPPAAASSPRGSTHHLHDAQGVSPAPPKLSGSTTLDIPISSTSSSVRYCKSLGRTVLHAPPEINDSAVTKTCRAYAPAIRARSAAQCCRRWRWSHPRTYIGVRKVAQRGKRSQAAITGHFLAEAFRCNRSRRFT
eukprot:COSAG04_NODE_3353_length_2891_cov_2.148108_3_plen_206_part_00